MSEIADMKSDLTDVYGGAEGERAGPSIASMMRAGAGNTITRAQWQATRDALATQLERYERMAPSCASCVYLDGSGWCAIWEAKPPAEFQFSGCDRWEWDGIPL